ncbi:MAG: tail fiber domain-containing protein [Ferruginibacter sp.]
MKLFSFLLLFFIILVLPVTVFTQSFSINTDGSIADNSAILDIKSTTKGLLMPRLTTVQKYAIATPAEGLKIYDTDTKTFWFYNGMVWTEIPDGSNSWNLSGNSLSNPANQFIGTLDDNPLLFRIKNINAGLIDSTTQNTAFGFRALDSAVITALQFNTAFGYKTLLNNTIGALNTAIGGNSLRSNKSGFSNVAVGYSSLFSNTTGGGNTAIGISALNNNTSGFQNTAIGMYAHFSSKSGVRNTSLGTEALVSDSSGNDNTAIGVYALSSSINANFNVAVGNNSLSYHKRNDYNTAIGGYALFWDTSGTSNTAVGYGSLFDNRNGIQNTAVGQGALYYNKASNNTAFGYGALSAIVTGYNNIAIGSGSGTHPSTPAIYNTISIGNNGFLNAYQNQAFIGNTSTIFIGGQVNWSTYSDARIKNNITEDVKGLDFITRLRPVSYYKDFASITSLTGNKVTEDYPGKYDGEQIKYSGFLAQEVEVAAKQSNYNFSGLHTPKGQYDLYSLSYAEFVVPLVKAVQEQQAMIKNQEKIIEEQKNKMEQLQKRVAAIEFKK